MHAPSRDDELSVAQQSAAGGRGMFEAWTPAFPVWSGREPPVPVGNPIARAVRAQLAEPESLPGIDTLGTPESRPEKIPRRQPGLPRASSWLTPAWDRAVELPADHGNALRYAPQVRLPVARFRRVTRRPQPPPCTQLPRSIPGNTRAAFVARPRLVFSTEATKHSIEAAARIPPRTTFSRSEYRQPCDASPRKMWVMTRA